VDAGRLPASVIEELKRIFDDFPGESEVLLEVHTRTGPRRLRFGDEFKVNGQNAALKAELYNVLGEAVLPPAVATPA
jgi:DNA polymerase-3 subunit alpha